MKVQVARRSKEMKAASHVTEAAVHMLQLVCNYHAWYETLAWLQCYFVGYPGTIVKGGSEFDVRDAIRQIHLILARQEPMIMEMSRSIKSRRNDKRLELIAEDIIPAPVNTKEDLNAFDKKLLKNKEFESDAVCFSLFIF